MIENYIKAATCMIVCEDKTGTGWLVAESLIITARHTVKAAISDGKKIELSFSAGKNNEIINAKVLKDDEDTDVCLLELEKKVDYSPLEFRLDISPEGSRWQSFGYPSSKLTIGHLLKGEVTHNLNETQLRMDIDLAVDPQYSLSDYAGLSGAVVVIDDFAVGLIRISLDGSLGAISLKSIEGFLKSSEITAEPSSKNQHGKVRKLAYVERTSFQDNLENLLIGNPGQIFFLEGAHGIGKTTFCETFKPKSNELQVLGTYSLTSKERGLGPVVRVQPAVFFEWLSSTISKFLVGIPPAKQDLPYEGLVQKTNFYIKEYSKYCTLQNKLGLIFIDAVNEGKTADPISMSKLIGLLPTDLPNNISVIYTAPNLDLVSSCFPTQFQKNKILNLPRLSDASCINYCERELSADKNHHEMIRRICEKAGGHPLYLRYLIEYVNEHDPESLNEFPVLSGHIEQYYESLWPKLLTDDSAINLLAIISRLRWGIATSQLLSLLQSVERVSFTSTIARIKHLLLNPDLTEVYHSSFAEFIIEKTSDLEHEIHERIANFCLDSKSKSYGKLNVIFHFLRSEETIARNAVNLCNQLWVDESVNLGVEPDVLISDIKDVMQLAIQQAMGVEVIRLLLLLQRVEFRYNILFAQSASLIANAFISLKKPKEAIKHVIRHRTLIVHEDEALKIIRLLLGYGFYDESLEIIQALHDQVIEPFLNSQSSSTLSEFVAIQSLFVELLAYAQLADGNDRSKTIISVIMHARDVLRDVEFYKDKPSEIHIVLSEVTAPAASTSMYFADNYIPINEIKKRNGNAEVPAEYLNNLLYLLSSYHSLVKEFGSPKNSESVQNLLKDIEELSATACRSKWKTPLIDVLIAQGASIELVQKLLNHIDLSECKPITLLKENGVDVAIDDIKLCILEWRVKYFLDATLACPEFVLYNKYKWKEYLNNLLQIISWCEGRAAHANALEDSHQSNLVLEFLNQKFLPNINFDLSERVSWDDSYAIPEDVMPILWERLGIIFTRYYPNQVSEFLSKVIDRVPKQFGIYSEGFRNSLRSILDTACKKDFDLTTSDQIFTLLEMFRKYISDGVENRHELVPELLELIPLYVRLGAGEEAIEVFKNVLAVSMGPSWYKEDQFSLLSSTLSLMDVNDSLNIELSKIAGYLDRASGEMTFQRFVRYEKNEFIGQLVRLNKFKEAFSYFRRQSYGTLEELIQDAKKGFVDRISPLVGSRFPGGAIEEQLAALKIVRKAKNVDWRLRWATLEAFQCGDIRHLEDFSKEYAILINENSDSAVQAEMFERLSLVITAEISEDFREEFLKNFLKVLDPKYHELLINPFFNKQETALENDKSNLIDDSAKIDSAPSDEEIDDKFFMPGTFGKRSAIPKAVGILKEAELLLSRKNYSASKSKAKDALKELQDAGWSIWGNLSGYSYRAEEILKIEAEANEAIKSYGQLILDEKFTARWSIAEHLISKVGVLFDADSKLEILRIVLEHIGLMVGDSKNEISENDYLKHISDRDIPNIETFNFLMSMSDHPQWRRREKIGPLIVWLIREDESYFEIVAKEAFSNNDGYASEFGALAIDVLSVQNSQETYTRLNEYANIKNAAKDCNCFNRLMILNRIVNRAAIKGVSEAKEISSIISNRFRSGYIEIDYIDVPRPLPDWLECISAELKSIAEMKLLSSELIKEIESELSASLKPISIHNAWEIESGLSRSFRESDEWPLNRWEGKVRHALNKAVLTFADQPKLQKLEAALRIYNPYTSELKLDANYVSNGPLIIESIVRNNDYVGAIGDQDHLFLHYQELVITKSDNLMSNEAKGFEVYSVIVDRDKLRQNISNALLSFHQRRQYLVEFEGVGLTCNKHVREFKYFGALTPAVPSSYFLSFNQISPEDFIRKVWRNGRSYTIHNMGRPEHEGSYLSVKRSAVNLPRNMELVWLVSIGSQTVAVNINNKRIM